MGNEYNRIHQKSTFLPMLCSRPSIKDVRLPKLKEKSTSFSSDPLSPRISCIGQVKRNNRVIGIPSSHSHTRLTLTTTTNPNIKYHKLKKLFSSKNISATATASTGATRCGGRRQLLRNETSLGKKEWANKKWDSVSIVDLDLDPPLPVIKRVNKSSGEMESLWKRRSGGVPLESLKLQQIQHSMPRLHLTTL